MKWCVVGIRPIDRINAALRFLMQHIWHVEGQCLIIYTLGQTRDERNLLEKMKWISQITLLFSALFFVIELNAQTLGRRFNYTQGTVELKNGTIHYGDVANIKHGFRDELVNGVRIRMSGTRRVKKYRPREINGYTMDNRKFVSWPVERNNALLKEMYTINSGHKYEVFELQQEGRLSIYLQYFLDDDLHIRTAPFFLKEGELVLVRATQGLFGLKRKFLSDYFKDCPTLVKLIEKNELTTPEEVAEFYNSCGEVPE